jgi:hypothetical protein
LLTASFVQAFWLNFCMQFSSLLCMPHALPILMKLTYRDSWNS